MDSFDQIIFIPKIKIINIKNGPLFLTNLVVINPRFSACRYR